MAMPGPSFMREYAARQHHEAVAPLLYFISESPPQNDGRCHTPVNARQHIIRPPIFASRWTKLIRVRRAQLTTARPPAHTYAAFTAIPAAASAMAF